jgi:hypothetical protein
MFQTVMELHAVVELTTIIILSGTDAVGQEIISGAVDIKTHLIGTDQEEITTTTEQFI